MATINFLLMNVVLQHAVLLIAVFSIFAHVYGYARLPPQRTDRADSAAAGFRLVGFLASALLLLGNRNRLPRLYTPFIVFGVSFEILFCGLMVLGTRNGHQTVFLTSSLTGRWKLAGFDTNTA